MCRQVEKWVTTERKAATNIVTQMKSNVKTFNILMYFRLGFCTRSFVLKTYVNCLTSRKLILHPRQQIDNKTQSQKLHNEFQQIPDGWRMTAC